MRHQFFQTIFTVSAVATAVAGCGGSSASDRGLVLPGGAQLVLTRAPDLTGAVTVATNQSGYTPEGYSSQYDIWIAIAPSQTANAGVVIAVSTPVFVSANGTIDAATAASIKAGDVVEVWHDATTVGGSVQAPPGAPAYNGTQIVIVR